MEILDKPTHERGSRSETEHTLNEWSIMTGRDDKTLLSAFRKCDFFPKPFDRIPFKRVEAALFGEQHAEKIRGMKLDNDQKEHDSAREAGELVPMGELGEIITQKIVVPVGSMLNSLPSSLDTRCNPTDPELARNALLDWVEKTAKPTLRSKLIDELPQDNTKEAKAA